MSSITVSTYIALHVERKGLAAKAPLQNGDELDATMNRLREIDSQLKETDSAFHGNSLANNLSEWYEVMTICNPLIMKSWWASWLPFGWMHSLAASYYARKARRIYFNKKESA